MLWLDAVKRRTLPAWIREGLEKMEREKQKKLEKERMDQQRSQLSKKEKKENEATGEEDGPRLPQKSKFVSGSLLMYFTLHLHFFLRVTVLAGKKFLFHVVLTKDSRLVMFSSLSSKALILSGFFFPPHSTLATMIFTSIDVTSSFQEILLGYTALFLGQL